MRALHFAISLVEDDHVSEELVEIVPGLIWAVIKPGSKDHSLQPSENLILPTPHSPSQPSPSFIETMFILILIHILFEYVR